MFKVIQKDATGQRVAVTGDTKRPRPWAGETLIWEGEARDEQEALRKAAETNPVEVEKG